MRQRGDVKALFARHAAWWRGEEMLVASVPYTPLGELWLPLKGGSLASEDIRVTPEILDLDRLVGPSEREGDLDFYGDRVRTRAPYVRVPWVEAVLGCPIRATIQGGSMRTDSFVTDWTEWGNEEEHFHDNWFHALTTLTEMLVERSGGRYAVVQTLMRGPSDLAEAVLGPELMCFSMYDHPDRLRRFLGEVTAVFIHVLKAQLERIPPLEGGYVNPFGVWAPGTVVRTQCDASSFLSPAQYAEWFLPYDIRICEAVDYSVIHLHSGSLHTVDALLEVERPHAIQISLDPEPSGPPVESLIPVLEKILAVKPLIVDGELSSGRVEHLQKRLPHGGLYISARKEE
ncbi:MAG: hypothetical protein ACLFV5_04825 [Anaerolineales bacterium]